MKTSSGAYVQPGHAPHARVDEPDAGPYAVKRMSCCPPPVVRGVTDALVVACPRNQDIQGKREARVFRFSLWRAICRGAGWGEAGYFRLQRGVRMCHVGKSIGVIKCGIDGNSLVAACRGGKCNGGEEKDDEEEDEEDEEEEEEEVEEGDESDNVAEEEDIEEDE